MSFRKLVLGLLGLGVICGIVICTSSALDQSAATLQTILRGIQFNESLIEDLTVDFVTETSSDKDYQSYLYRQLSKSMGEEVEPPPLKTLSEHTSKLKGRRVYYTYRLVYPTSWPGGVPDRLEAAFDGEKVTWARWYTGKALAGATGTEMLGGLHMFASHFCLQFRGKPLGEALERWSPELVGKEEIDGHSCYVLELPPAGEDENVTRFWVDCSSGFGVRRRVVYWPNGEVNNWQNMQEFKEYADGVWMPTKVIWRRYSSTETYGKHIMHSKSVATVQELQVNTGLPDTSFVLRLPEGTRVYDRRTEESYIVPEKPRTDEEILKVAELGASFMAGEIEWEDIQSEITGEIIELPEVGVIGKGVATNADWGPKSLLIVCGLLGVGASSEELARLANLDEHGCTTFDGLLQVAEAKGLDAATETLTLNELATRDALAIGCIYGRRFVVILGFKADRVVVIDPPTLLLFVPINYLEERWDGQALMISSKER